MACAEYLRASRVGFVFDTDESTGRISVRLRADTEPPLSLGVIVGDVLHNLRSALDSAAWETCRRVGVEPEREAQVYFPIGVDPRRWSSQAERMLPGVTADRLRVFHELQPWFYAEVARGYGIEVDGSSAQQHPLYRLHQLGRVDRHRVPHPVLARAGLTWLGSPDGVDVAVQPGDQPPWGPGSLVLEWVVTPAGRVHDVSPAGEPVLALNEAAALAGLSASAELRAMRDAVASALRRIEIEVLRVVSPSLMAELAALESSLQEAEEALATLQNEPRVLDADRLRRHSLLLERRDVARSAYTQKWRELFE